MNNEDKKFGAITSAVDQEKISLTVMATVRVVAGVAVFLGALSVGDSAILLENVNQVVANVITIVVTATPLAYAAWNAGEIVVGIVQKALVALFKKA